jgi:hypothetical protein
MPGVTIDPVPPGVSSKSAFESVVILLSNKFKLSTAIELAVTEVNVGVSDPVIVRFGPLTAVEM